MEDGWNNTGRKTINTKVVHKNGKHVFSFIGSEQDKEPKPELNLEHGVVYRINLTDRSLGNDSGHPLSFATSVDDMIDGSELERYVSRSNKKPGNRGAYIYFKVPSISQRIYYYCKNHQGMGNRVNVKFQERNSTDDPIVYPDDGDGIGGGSGVDGINECCDCMDCLMRGIRETESGDPCIPGEHGRPNDPCDAFVCNGCNAVNRPGTGCGHYQLFEGFVLDAARACPEHPDNDPMGRPNIPECCELMQLVSNKPLHAFLCTPCPQGDVDCCAEKKRLAELAIACSQRTWTRNL